MEGRRWEGRVSEGLLKGHPRRSYVASIDRFIDLQTVQARMVTLITELKISERNISAAMEESSSRIFLNIFL